MIDVQGGDISASKIILSNPQFCVSYYIIKNSKLGIQIHNYGYDNQIHHMLTIVFNWIKKLQIP